MTTVAQLESCDGFTVESPDGAVGWVEETWLDAEGHPAAVAVRTPDGRRALLRAEDVQAADPDAQEVLVGRGAELLALDPPRLASADGTIAATWHATAEHVHPGLAPARARPPIQALTAARGTTAHTERTLVHTIAIALATIATLIAVEIGLAYGIAYAVTGNPPY